MFLFLFIILYHVQQHKWDKNKYIITIFATCHICIYKVSVLNNGSQNKDNNDL